MTTDMKKTALCHCGDLKVECEGTPSPIFMCHCAACQRRTGSSFNLGAWFPEDGVKVSGEYKQYSRTGAEGTTFVFHFCPNCGSNVYWKAAGDLVGEFQTLTGLVGVAVGCFADAEFPGPTLSFFAKRRHKWLTQPDGCPSLIAGLNEGVE